MLASDLGRDGVAEGPLNLDSNELLRRSMANSDHIEDLDQLMGQRESGVHYRLRNLLLFSRNLELTIEIFSEKLSSTEEMLFIRILAPHHGRWKNFSLHSRRFPDNAVNIDHICRGGLS